MEGVRPVEVGIGLADDGVGGEDGGGARGQRSEGGRPEGKRTSPLIPLPSDGRGSRAEREKTRRGQATAGARTACPRDRRSRLGAGPCGQAVRAPGLGAPCAFSWLVVVTKYVHGFHLFNRRGGRDLTRNRAGSRQSGAEPPLSKVWHPVRFFVARYFHSFSSGVYTVVFISEWLGKNNAICNRAFWVCTLLK